MPSGRLPNRIGIPGLRTKTGVPGGARGTLLGRRSAFGPVELLTFDMLEAMGIKAKSNNQIVNQAGFNFSTDGRPTDNQFVGRGTWSRDIHFHNSDPNNVVTAVSGATGTPSFRMLLDDLTSLGTIQFTSPTVAVVTWNSDPYIHPATVGLNLYAPTPQDATLARVSGRVVGYL